MLDRINAWITARVNKKASSKPAYVAVEPDGLRLSDETAEALVPWTNIQRIIAYSRPDGMGVAHCLAVETSDGKVLEFMDSVLDPDDPILDLGAYLPLEMSPSAWRTRLLSEPETLLVIYDGTPIRSLKP